MSPSREANSQSNHHPQHIWPIFALYALFCGYFIPLVPRISLYLACLCLLYLLWLCWRNPTGICLVVCLLLAFSFAYGLRSGQKGKQRLVRPGRHVCRCRVTGATETGPYVLTIPVSVQQIDGQHAGYPARVQLSYDLANRQLLRSLRVGDCLEVDGSVELQRDFRFLLHLRTSDFYRLSVRALAITAHTPAPRLRLSSLLLSLPHDSLLIPLISGDKSLLSCRTKQLLRDSGLYHLFVVSGFHLALLSYLLFKLVRLLLPIVPTVVVVLLLLAVYLWLIGCPVPALRAYIMVGIYFLANLFHRQAFPVHVLLLAAWLICLLRPSQIFQLSFLLSFLALTGIFLFLPLLDHLPAHPLPRFVLTCQSLSVFALSALAPLLIGVFKQLPLWGMLIAPLAFCLAVLLLAAGGLYLAVGVPLLLVQAINNLFLAVLGSPCARLLLLKPSPIHAWWAYYLVLILLARLLTRRSCAWLACLLLLSVVLHQAAAVPKPRFQTITVEHKGRYHMRVTDSEVFYSGMLSWDMYERLQRLGHVRTRRLIVRTPYRYHLVSKLFALSRAYQRVRLDIVASGPQCARKRYTRLMCRELGIRARWLPVD